MLIALSGLAIEGSGAIINHGAKLALLGAASLNSPSEGRTGAAR
jgi:hypothetical protein